MTIVFALILAFVIGGSVAVLAFRKNEAKIEETVSTVKSDVAEVAGGLSTTAGDVKKAL